MTSRRTRTPTYSTNYTTTSSFTSTSSSSTPTSSTTRPTSVTKRQSPAKQLRAHAIGEKFDVYKVPVEQVQGILKHRKDQQGNILPATHQQGITWSQPQQLHQQEVVYYATPYQTLQQYYYNYSQRQQQQVPEYYSYWNTFQRQDMPQMEYFTPTSQQLGPFPYTAQVANPAFNDSFANYKSSTFSSNSDSVANVSLTQRVSNI